MEHITAMTALLIILAAMAKASMDKVNFHYSTSIFKTLNPHFFNPYYSWRNKWKNGIVGKEKFPFSSTLFVFTTDFWHLAQFVFLNCLFFAIVFYEGDNLFLDFIIFRIIFGVTFQITYKYILND